MAVKRTSLILSFFLLSNGVVAQEQSLMECSKILDDSKRLACYDAAMMVVEETLELPQKGTEAERIESRDAAVTAVIVGRERSEEVRKQAPAQAKFKIAELAFNRRGEMTYVTDDGRRFKKLTQQAGGIRSGDEVYIEGGMFGSLFLICEARNARIKVKAL